MRKLYTAAAAVFAAVLLVSCDTQVGENETAAEIYYTDIKASIDGAAVPVGEINGKAAIKLQDMTGYGFVLSESAYNGRVDLTTDYMADGVAGKDADPRHPEETRACFSMWAISLGDKTC